MNGFFLLKTLLVILILAASATPKGTAAERAGVVGWWRFDFPALSLQLLLKISQEANGTFHATERNICFSEEDLPITPFWCDGKNVRYELDGGTFGLLQLALNDKGDKLEGFYKNSDLEIPLAYTRVDPGSVKPSPKLAYSLEAGARGLQGYWSGKMTRDGADFHYAFRIGRADDGSFHGRFDLFEAGRRNHLLNHVSLTDNQVRFENTDISFSYKGELSADGRSIKGKLADWFESGELVLHRLEKPAELELPVMRSGDSGFEGIWDAWMDPQRSDLRMRVRLGRARDGAYLATVNNPDEQTPTPVPSTRIEVKEQNLRIEWKGRSCAFEGAFKGGALVGRWEEGKARTPVVFRRVALEGAQ